MKAGIIFNAILITALIVSCEDNSGAYVAQQSPLTNKDLHGYAQKGPFTNGSTVSIIELKNDLIQTGRLYTAAIIDNSGAFAVSNMNLASPFVYLKADGYYYNEVKGDVSDGPITLNALADVSETSQVNINILTHLEKQRLEYLCSKEGKSFSLAKEQAAQEVRAIFGFTSSSSVQFLSKFPKYPGKLDNVFRSKQNAEFLNLTEDAVLLAASCILQGQLSTGKMMELMANIASDLSIDGVLNNDLYKTQLVTNAAYLNLPKIRQNLQTRYAELGIDVSIPDFESLVQYFIDSSDSEPAPNITYPALGKYGENILSDITTAFVAGTPNYYSLSADLQAGASLKIIMRATITGGGWYYYAVPNSNENWLITPYDYATRSQTFTILEAGKRSDLKMYFNANETKVIVEFYENESTSPTKVKTINQHNTSCQFNNPLTDLQWLADMISTVTLYSGTLKIYQCLYNGGVTGFICEASYPNYSNVYKTFHNCSGDALCVADANGNFSCIGLDIESQNLIYDSSAK